MTNCDLAKNNLRKIYRTKRNELTRDEVAKKSKKICENFITNLLPTLLKQKPDALFSIYLDSYNEVQTKNIIDFFKANKISFCYPKIIAQNRELKFIAHQAIQDFSPNKIYPEILEPKNGKEVIPNFLIIPLLAIDKKRNRLGMGGGFFDRSLAHFKTKNHKIITTGLAYDFQLHREDLPHDKNDQSLDFIALENDIIC